MLSKLVIFACAVVGATGYGFPGFIAGAALSWLGLVMLRWFTWRAVKPQVRVLDSVQGIYAVGNRFVVHPRLKYDTGFVLACIDKGPALTLMISPRYRTYTLKTTDMVLLKEGSYINNKPITALAEYFWAAPDSIWDCVDMDDSYRPPWATQAPAEPRS